MDLEDELRQAMAEHVTEVSAPRTLAAEAKRRHHRTVRRRTAFAVGAAGLVVAVAMVPAYQSFRPQTVGADGPGGRSRSPRPTGSPAPPATPSPNGRTPSPATGSTGSHSSGIPAKRPESPQSPGAAAVVKVLLGYLPKGIDPAKTCTTDHSGARETTTCRWSGSGGWIDVRLIRASGLSGPADLGLVSPMAEQIKVNGHPALRDGAPGMPVVTWIERHGLGVWVGVSPSLSDRLTQIAEGVHVT
jgi:hypothetical protein